jgi:TatD DNase family protein
MTSIHASKPHLETLPSSLRSLFIPPATQPDRFVLGKPIKGRNEPMAVGAVAWVIHRLVEGIPFESITEKAWENTIELFQLDDL